MARDQIHLTAAAMMAYGGRFVRSLGQALAVADDDNSARIVNAFPGLMDQYGPGSEAHMAIQRRQIHQPEVSDSDFGAFTEASK